MKTVVMEGTIKNVSPLLIMLPESENSGQKTLRHPCVPVAVGEKIIHVPVIPGNTVRGALRRQIAFSVLSRFKDLDYITITFWACGGVVDPREEKNKKGRIGIDRIFSLVRTLKEKNVVADLFGGSLPVLNMIHGSLITEFAFAKVREIYPGYPDSTDIYLKDLTFARLDETLRNFEVYKLLSKEGKAELERRFQSKKERTEAGDSKQKKGETANIIGSLGEAVIPGTEFQHRMELTNPTARNTGAVLFALAKFAETDATLGGYSRFGFGKIAFEYNVYEVNNNKKELTGTIKGGWITKNGTLTRYVEMDNTLTEYLSAFNKYLTGMTRDDVVIKIPVS